MSPSRTITIGIALTIVSITVFVVSCLFMSLRISDYYRNAPPPEYLFKSITIRSFPLWGKDVKLTDATTAGGNAALRISYGENEILLPVHAPKVPNIPDLGVYDEWLAVAAFAKLESGQVNMDLDLNQAKDFRVAVVKRNPAPGHDDDMGGLVGRKQWTFEIVEFQKDGTLTHRVMQFPATEYTTGKQYLPALKADPDAKVEPIAERSWEFQIALLAIPKLHISNYRFKTTAVSAMGWTLPAAGFSMMGFMGGIAIWQAGRIGRKKTAVHSAPADTDQGS